MNVNEAKKLSDAEVGKLIVEKIGFKIVYKHFYRSPMFYHYRLTRLCTDLNAIAEVEKLVIEKNRDAYVFALANTTGVALSSSITKIHLAFITASARERAEACLMVLSENQNSDSEK
jgi:hypothetical protein